MQHKSICVTMTVWIPVIQCQCCEGASTTPQGNKCLPEQFQKQNINNTYHRHSQFAANSHSNHTKYKGDMGSGNLGANQNQHFLSWEGPRAFVICLQTSMIHPLEVIVGCGKGSSHNPEIQFRDMHLISLYPHASDVYKQYLCAGEALAVSLLQVLYISYKGMTSPLHQTHNECKYLSIIFD